MINPSIDPDRYEDKGGEGQTEIIPSIDRSWDDFMQGFLAEGHLKGERERRRRRRGGGGGGGEEEEGEEEERRKKRRGEEEEERRRRRGGGEEEEEEREDISQLGYIKRASMTSKDVLQGGELIWSPICTLVINEPIEPHLPLEIR